MKEIWGGGALGGPYWNSALSGRVEVQLLEDPTSDAGLQGELFQQTERTDNTNMLIPLHFSTSRGTRLSKSMASTSPTWTTRR